MPPTNEDQMRQMAEMHEMQMQQLRAEMDGKNRYMMNNMKGQME